MEPRGLRNNNPLNIRKTTTKWQGQVEHLNGRTDKAFCQFRDLKYGYRAAAKLLLNYQTIHGCRTIRQIINRWAPPVENNTGMYVHRVVESIHEGGYPYTADTPVHLAQDPKLFLRLLMGMHAVENGSRPTAEHLRAAQEGILMLR